MLFCNYECDFAHKKHVLVRQSLLKLDVGVNFWPLCCRCTSSTGSRGPAARCTSSKHLVSASTQLAGQPESVCIKHDSCAELAAEGQSSYPKNQHSACHNNSIEGVIISLKAQGISTRTCTDMLKIWPSTSLKSKSPTAGHTGRWLLKPYLSTWFWAGVDDFKLFILSKANQLSWQCF